MAEAALLLPAEPAAERDSREKLALWDRRPDTKAPLTDRQTDSVLELKAAAENLPVPAEVRRRAGPGLRRRREAVPGCAPRGRTLALRTPVSVPCLLAAAAARAGEAPRLPGPPPVPLRAGARRPPAPSPPPAARTVGPEPGPRVPGVPGVSRGTALLPTASQAERPPSPKCSAWGRPPLRGHLSPH